jgi:hypothetical protein
VALLDAILERSPEEWLRQRREALGAGGPKIIEISFEKKNLNRRRITSSAWLQLLGRQKGTPGNSTEGRTTNASALPPESSAGESRNARTVGSARQEARAKRT